MPKAKQVTKAAAGPEVLRFEAQLLAAPKAICLRLPTTISDKLGTMAKVEGTINGHPFRAALEGEASGERTLRVNAAMLKGAGAKAGDTVALAILGPEPEPQAPPDLAGPLAASQEAKYLWEQLTPLGQRDWIRWIELAKTADTRARRVTRTVEQLAEGKRRPCCVNVNEFMLCRIQASDAE